MTEVRESVAPIRAIALPRSGRTLDALVCGVFLAASLLLYRGLWWGGPGGRYLVDSGQDQRQWEWFFAVTARAVAHGENPLTTTLQNHPDGVNLMANTSMPGLSIPLAPITWLFGPSATWAIVLTFGLAATAAAWYYLISRHLDVSRPAAALGGAFCAFAPPMISHANAHPNLAVLFVIPLIIDRLLRVAGGLRPIRDGILLGLLTTYQIFLGEEALLLASTGIALFAIGYACAAPSAARAVLRPLARGVPIGAALCLVLVAYPLWWQFNGPQSYTNLLHGPAGNDLAALSAYADRSLAGDIDVSSRLSMNRTEENAFFGWPLLLLALALVVALWRTALTKALAVVLVGAALFSLGPEIVLNGEPTGIDGPWRWLGQLPLYESVLESRFTMVCVPAFGMLLALGAQAATRTRDRRIRLLWCVAALQALVPLLPQPLTTQPREATPAFFTDGTWRQYVGPGRAIVTVPLPDPSDARALSWQVDADLGFPLAEGYFVGPFGPDRLGGYGAVTRPTSNLLREVRDSGKVPEVTEQDRAQARADLAFWHADVVVLGPHYQENALWSTLELLLGPSRQTGGVWVWDVRGGNGRAVDARNGGAAGAG
ncbi:glycosyl transferase [Embleya sp. MST-111070]|uniref:glycosyl transferase n=1 Tax=Embleya sp. MST-111070 TaxID=3398231 RepID=UPI003F73B065